MMTRGRRRAGAIVLGLAFAASCRTQRDLDPEPPRPRPLAGMVVCEAPLAGEVGAKVLRDGGNAVDAAVATALALAVVLPQAGNLGGGGFALFVPHEGEPQALDFRERAPATADASRFLDAEGKLIGEMSLAGPWSVAVPGSAAGLFELLDRLGSQRFSFAELAQPAVDLARKGFLVDAGLERDLGDEDFRRRLESSPAAKELFYPNGTQLRRGERLVQSDLAKTLELLGKAGPEVFYRGSIAGSIIAELQIQGDVNGAAGGMEVGSRGMLSARDLADYAPVWREPLRGWFRGMEVITMPPPSSGGIALLETLAVLDGFPIEAERRALSAAELAAGGLPERAVHWWIEALRRAFAERAEHLGDPDFVAVPLERLLSPEWVARARVSIGEAAAPETLAQSAIREGQETTHISVLDSKGNALSLSTTLNSTFGSGILVRGGGFFLNDEMDDFALQAGVANQFGLVGGKANALEPGKRPLSSMAPTVLRRGGSVAMVLGSPGGPKIITSVIGVIVRTLLFEQSLADAVAAPRFHQQWSPPVTEFEPGWPGELLEALSRRGHAVQAVEKRWGRVQAIRVLPGGNVEGASDPRGGGSAIPVKR
ncbi:MAG TPA: gamma-glutamyltransferase [Planctomycetota bacterium]|nr:gamma-glutamyltransferase [Planctomycetota bacterium]